MNAITPVEPVSSVTLEHVLGTGDLSKLSTPQRVEYYRRTCETIGVNPLTRPFRFMSLNGQLILYATRDLTDQLRQRDKVRISIVDKALDGDLFIVTARATLPDGRQDEDVGAVSIGRLQGEARANAVMKAMTKAKRRVTLSICGLGFTDESEIDSIPGAKAFAVDEEPPTAPIRTAIAAEPAPEPTASAESASDKKWHAWLHRLRQATEDAIDRAAVVEIGGRQSVADALASAPDWVKDDIRAMLADAFGRMPEEAAEPEAVEADDSWPGPKP